MLAVAMLIVSTSAMADTMTVVSDTSVYVYGPLDHYAAIDSADWSTSKPAVVTWVHGSWPTITGATWISSAYNTEEPAADNSWRLFEDVIEIPACAISIDGNLVSITSDNAEEAYLNGNLIGSDGELEGPFVDNQEWSSVLSYPLTGLAAGTNTLKIIVRNYAGSSSPTSNPTGLIYKADITYTLADADGDGYNCADDCDDTNIVVHPGAPETECNGIDNDCDTVIDEDYINTPTTCGIGECAADGELTCVDGEEIDTCIAGTPTEEIYDSKDNNCNGQTDEGFCTDQNTAKQFLETVYVSPDGNPYSSNNSLESGEEYIVKASGTYKFANWGNYGIADAEWAYRRAPYYPTDPSYEDVVPDQGSTTSGWVKGEGYYASECGLDLQLGGSCVDWGGFNPEHVYFNSVIGDGTPLPLSFLIYDSAYTDNSGSLTADIYFCNPDKDGDGYDYNDDDCDDNNAAIHPEAKELCNALDDDCDAEIDEDNVCVWECGTTMKDSQYLKLGLGVNRWIWNGSWETVKPKGKGPRFLPTLEYTHQCGCEQILGWLHTNLPDLYGKMNGHWKYGCSKSAIEDFMGLADEIPYTVGTVGFSSPWGNVELDFNAYEVLPETGEVNWARVTGSINSWSGLVIWTDVTGNTALFTVSVDESTVPAVEGCDITFKVIDGGEPGIGVDSVEITAVENPPGETTCSAIGQVQGPWIINAGNLEVYD